jgi:hypothetical protein
MPRLHGWEYPELTPERIVDIARLDTAYALDMASGIDRTTERLELDMELQATLEDLRARNLYLTRDFVGQHIAAAYAMARREAAYHRTSR